MRSTFVLLAAALLIGCQAAPKQTASALRKSTVDQTEKINVAVDGAQAHIAKADKAVQVASTQPANPPVTAAALTTAHSELGAAAIALTPIRPATATIQVNAVKAEQVTVKAVDALAAEQNHWLGAKARKALTIGGIAFGSVALVFGILVFIIKTAGGGPIMQAFGQIGGDIIAIFWTYLLKPIGVFIYHVCTLGLAKLADIVNKIKTEVSHPK